MVVYSSEEGKVKGWRPTNGISLPAAGVTCILLDQKAAALDLPHKCDTTDGRERNHCAGTVKNESDAPISTLHIVTKNRASLV